MMKEQKRQMSVAELQEYFGISRQTAYRLVNQPDFPAYRIGDRILVDPDSLKEWIDRQVFINKEAEV